MPLKIIISAQWGDDGAEQIGEYLASGADYVARFNGGDYAGQPVSAGNRTFSLFLIPSGVIRSQTIAAIGNGMVINPKILINDISKLRDAGVEINPDRLLISHAAHIITPAYLALDQAREQARGEKPVIVPFRGIGPAYNHKTARSGLRMEDMLSIDNFAKEIMAQIESANDVLIELYETEPIDAEAATREYIDYAYELAPYVANVSAHLSDAIHSGATILAVGNQGTLLDIDHGHYPSVSSSTTTSAGALVGLGLGLDSTNRVVGVTRAYQTFLGNSPFPTEILSDIFGRHGGNGKKPGQRPDMPSRRRRRFGWLDGVLLEYAIQINGINELAITDLSALSGMDTLCICTGYRDSDGMFHRLPFGPTRLINEPIYEELSGWQREIMNVKKWRQLPKEAQRYVRFIEEFTELPVRYITVGPELKQVIEVK